MKAKDLARSESTAPVMLGLEPPLRFSLISHTTLVCVKHSTMYKNHKKLKSHDVCAVYSD